MDQGPKGVAALRGAIEAGPDYWPPYTVMSDYFKQNGDIAKAREWVEKGLAAAPNARPLIRRKAQLDAVPGNGAKNSQSSAKR